MSADSATFLLCWLVSNALFLSAAGSKLLTYALPMFPAVALLVVISWTLGVGAGGLRGAKAACWIEGLSIVALPLGASLVAVSDGPLSTARLWLLGTCAAGGGALWLLSIRTWLSGARRELEDASPPVWPRAAVIAAVYAGVVSCLYGPVANRHSAKALSAHFNESGRLPRRLFVFDERLGSLLFYLTPALRAECSTDRLRPVDFGELRQAARTMALGDVVAIPTQAVALVSRSLPAGSLPFVPVADRYRLYSAPELLQAPAASVP
jgi:4-amino-4-deoxy-L-arabinose transferase-like glycosyltransferase